MWKRALLAVLRFLYLKGYWLFGRQEFKRIPLVRAVNRRIVGAFKDRVAIVDGHKMFIDKHDSLRLSLFGCYEPGETRLVKEVVQPGDCVLDVGAHIGYYTLQFARLVGSQGRVYAFEPDAENFELLERNVRENRYDNVTLVPKAVADSTGKRMLHRSRTNTGDHRITETPEPREAIEVEGVALDDYFAEECPRVDFVKMDIQGSESLALKGMRRVLGQASARRMIVEWSPGAMKSAGFQPSEFLDLLDNLGFRFNLVSDHRSGVDPIGKEELLKREDLANLYCVRGESRNDSD